jgi:hypothetical protein
MYATNIIRTLATLSFVINSLFQLSLLKFNVFQSSDPAVVQ